jgi:hypothetical protein
VDLNARMKGAHLPLLFQLQLQGVARACVVRRTGRLALARHERVTQSSDGQGGSRGRFAAAEIVQRCRPPYREGGTSAAPGKTKDAAETGFEPCRFRFWIHGDDRSLRRWTLAATEYSLGEETQYKKQSHVRSACIP